MQCFEIGEQINKKLVNFILYILQVEEHGDRRERIIYSILVLLTETEKIFFNLFLFALFGQVKSGVCSILVILSLRIFMGGIHRKTTIGCILQTFLTISFIIICSKRIYFSSIAMYGMFLIYVLLIWCSTPLPSEKRICYSEKQRLTFKLKALTVLVLLIVFVQIVGKCVKNLILWTMAIQLFEVCIVFLGLKRKEGRVHE